MNLFNIEHCREQNLTYLQHFRQAISYAATLALSAIKCTVHAFIPSLFDTAASDIIKSITSDIENTKRANKDPLSIKRAVIESWNSSFQYKPSFFLK